MPITTRALATDPLRSFKFNVSIFNQTNGNGLGNEIRLGFMSVSGLGISVEPLTYREGGDNLTTRKMPGQSDFNPISLSRGLFAGDDDNWNWMTTIFTAMYGGAATTNVPASGVNNDFRVGVYINVLEHPNNTTQASGGIYGVSYPYQDNIVKVSFKLYSAWIGSLAYSDFDAGGNSVSVEQMTLNYEGFDMRWGGTGYVANPRGW
jgi:phage tail-like protein